MKLSRALKTFKDKLEIMEVFVMNPEWHTRYGIAKALGRTEKEISSHLDQLVRSGLVGVAKEEGVTKYLLKPFANVCLDGMVFIRVNKDKPSKENLVVLNCKYADNCRVNDCFSEECKLRNDGTLEKLTNLYRFVEEVTDESE